MEPFTTAGPPRRPLRPGSRPAVLLDVENPGPPARGVQHLNVSQLAGFRCLGNIYGAGHPAQMGCWNGPGGIRPPNRRKLAALAPFCAAPGGLRQGLSGPESHQAAIESELPERMGG